MPNNVFDGDWRYRLMPVPPPTEPAPSGAQVGGASDRLAMTSIISGVAGLVLGFLAFVGAPLAIVTGVLALRQGFARGSNGKTFAIIGIVTGGLALIGIVVGLAYFYSRRAA